MTRNELLAIPVIAAGIERKTEALRDLRDAAISLSSPELGRRAQQGGHADRVGSFAARITDLEAEIRDDRLTLAERRLEAHKLFKTLPDPQLQVIMGLRYEAGYTWERVTEAAELTERHIYRLNRRALSMLFDDTQPSPVQTPNEGQLQK